MELFESAALCGGHCWVERRAFEVFGSWAAAAAGAEATVVLDRHSLHAAWRAGQWWERLPVLASVEREDLVVAAPGWERFLGPAGSPPLVPAGDVAALAVAYRVVLPRLAAAYRDHRARVAPLAEGPVLRTLVHAAGDVHADWEEGEALLQAVMRGPEDAAGAAEAVRRAESALIGAD